MLDVAEVVDDVVAGDVDLVVDLEVVGGFEEEVDAPGVEVIWDVVEDADIAFFRLRITSETPNIETPTAAPPTSMNLMTFLRSKTFLFSLIEGTSAL